MSLVLQEADRECSFIFHFAKLFATKSEEYSRNVSLTSQLKRISVISPRKESRWLEKRLCDILQNPKKL